MQDLTVKTIISDRELVFLRDEGKDRFEWERCQRRSKIARVLMEEMPLDQWQLFRLRESKHREASSNNLVFVTRLDVGRVVQRGYCEMIEAPPIPVDLSWRRAVQQILREKQTMKRLSRVAALVAAILVFVAIW